MRLAAGGVGASVTMDSAMGSASGCRRSGRDTAVFRQSRATMTAHFLNEPPDIRQVPSSAALLVPEPYRLAEALQTPRQLGHRQLSSTASIPTDGSPRELLASELPLAHKQTSLINHTRSSRRSWTTPSDSPSLGGVQCDQCINRSEYILVDKIRRLGRDAHYLRLDAEQDIRVLFFDSCIHSSIHHLTIELSHRQAAPRFNRRLKCFVARGDIFRKQIQDRCPHPTPMQSCQKTHEQS